MLRPGRKANVDDLGLDSAGIKWSPRGIEVDSGLRTTNRRIYAIGDVAGGFQFTHMANYHAGLVIRNALFGFPARVNTDIVPWWSPIRIRNWRILVSMKCKRASVLEIRYPVLRWQFDENDRARTTHSTNGLIKAIVAPRGKILGAGIVGKNAGDLNIALVSCGFIGLKD